MNRETILIILGIVLALVAHAAISRQLSQAKRKPEGPAVDVPPIGGEESVLAGGLEIKEAGE